MCKLTKNEIETKLEELKEWLSDDDIADILKDFQDGIKFSSPNKKDVFNAFKSDKIKPNNIKILILGQDPYPNPEKAQGLAFSHKNGVSIDASLLNIFKAIKAYKENKKFDEIDKEDISEWDTNLEDWATNKNNIVLLLNTALTYESDKNPHFKHWENFIQKIIINLLKTNSKKLVVFLWGNEAQKTFLRALNQIEYKACIENLKSENQDIFYKRNQEKLKINNKQIRANIDIKINNSEIKLLMTSHPSNNYQSVKKGFEEDAPNQFKVCDEFLGEYIWKNFPKKS